MQRNVSLEEISDGRLYGPGDMVKVGCDDCRGCSSCCHGAGNTVVLDPYDVYRLTAGLNKTLEEMVAASQIEFSVVDNIILPNLTMSGPEEACAFLDREGRCSIHPFRPGICRLFPLGRIYEDGGFRYFNQIHECRKEARTKVKVKKWIDTPDLAQYDAYIAEYHYFVKALETWIRAAEAGEGEPLCADSDSQDSQSASEAGFREREAAAKRVSMYILKTFYLTPYDPARDFYEQFRPRILAAREYWEIG